MYQDHVQIRASIHRMAASAEYDADMAALVRLALDSGGRLGELLATTWETWT